MSYSSKNWPPYKARGELRALAFWYIESTGKPLEFCELLEELAVEIHEKEDKKKRYVQTPLTEPGHYYYDGEGIVAVGPDDVNAEAKQTPPISPSSIIFDPLYEIRTAEESEGHSVAKRPYAEDAYCETGKCLCNDCPECIELDKELEEAENRARCEREENLRNA